jgi:hypothetical protein
MTKISQEISAISDSAIVNEWFYDNADYESAVSLTAALIEILNLNSLLSP